ncbi:alpha/beta fold hydrolase [Methanobacterium alcaliphilum]|uniref:alpha/beta fold hydrolase n=1 Tax=Methanobacterium alcaliphilum TaxID=392018 RepID=UPI002009F5E5|nr:alpha/beta hydrolase [Methanobacterium alcaliphilum]MCK9151189.1 alpha/beta hydrolase [Methanobacterium alcaliphilum]
MVEKSPFPEEWQTEYLSAYLKVMKLWGVEYQSYEVETSFGTTHLNLSGSDTKPPLILLHAAAVSSVEWYANAAVLSQHFNILAIDTMGDCGWSRPQKQIKSREQYNQWLLEIIDHFQLEKINIMGHSYGGWLALNFAMSNPERLDKLVLLAPAASITSFKLFMQIALRMPNLPIMPSTEKTLKMMAHRDYQPPNEFITFMDIVNKHCRPKMVFPTVYTDKELQSVTTPTLLLVGDEEKIYSPLKAVERARKNIPNLKSEIIMKAGHTLNMEQPDIVNSKVIQFLNK